MQRDNFFDEEDSDGRDGHHEDEYSDASEESGDDANTPRGLEKALIKTIKQFATFVSSITNDLEEQEQEELDRLASLGKPLPKAIWADSTFKIDFTKGLLMTVFKPERLMKYYIIFLLPMKKWLLKRNEEFFLKAQVFPGAPEEDIRFFRDLWAIDGTMTQDEKNTIWEFWDTQIEIVEDWQEMTQWVVNPDEDLNIPNIDYIQAAKEVGVDLDSE